jgi:hypothetical protein
MNRLSQIGGAGKTVVEGTLNEPATDARGNARSQNYSTKSVPRRKPTTMILTEIY